MELDILMNDINVYALGSAVMGIIFSAMATLFSNASKKLIKFLSISFLIFISGTIGGTMGIIFFSYNPYITIGLHVVMFIILSTTVSKFIDLDLEK